MSEYTGVEFYAETVRKGSRRLTGNVLVANPARQNGTCILVLSAPKGRPGLPVLTWASRRHLDGQIRVDETTARSIDPIVMAVVDLWESSQTFRALYRKRILREGSSLQIAEVP